MTTQQVRPRRPAPEGADRRPRARPSGTGGPTRRTAVTPAGTPADARRTLLAAAVVLALWFTWLLVPGPAKVAMVGEGVVVADAGTAAPAGPADDLLRGAARGPVVGPVAGARVDDAAQPVAPRADAPEAEPAQDAAAESAPPVAPEASAAPVAPPAEPAGPVTVPKAGDGTFVVAPGSSPQVGNGRLVRYTVEVEGGVPLDVGEVAGVVDQVLVDPRSWTGQGRWALQRVDAEPDVRIVVTSPDTSDRLCAPLRTRGELSCRNGDDVVLNAVRWTQGARSWGDDVDGYRQYLVNHELGHYLGMGHVGCPEDGTPAPVMLQQTLGLQGCTPNAWPYP